ncbi:zf-DHHC-domain-containing protein [Fistulina hepatica ATCC 64428]|nr:zf-DHHC-domain-containing protein [Fistulina hepatica ATCC 64428]
MEPRYQERAFTDTDGNVMYVPELSSRRWTDCIQLGVTVTLIIAPHPSWHYVLIRYYLSLRGNSWLFAFHLCATYALTIMSLSSLAICATRDPGPVTPTSQRGRIVDEEEDVEEIELSEQLLSTDLNLPGKWCNKCWAPKPDRTHHCSMCGRCVLKMDHHCPWIGARCIGHRTYPAFLHFLTCVTLLAAYITIICIFVLIAAFNEPTVIDEYSPIHALFLMFAGMVIMITIGSFLCYHIYLVSTNQTTLENISPFLLLRHLPPLPETTPPHSLSNPPIEPELSYSQRMLVKDAHAKIRVYDIGWRNNWGQVFGVTRRAGWLKRLADGGPPRGDGKHFPRNPRADTMLAHLASELVNSRNK